MPDSLDPTLPHLILDGHPSKLDPDPTIRISIHIPQSVLATLNALGMGLPSRGVCIAVADALKYDPSRVPKMQVQLDKPDKPTRASRKLRDAYIYHECLARSFTRREIAKRHGLSLIRVHQIFAEQAKNPPNLPLEYQVVSKEREVVSTPSLDSSIQSLIANWME